MTADSSLLLRRDEPAPACGDASFDSNHHESTPRSIIVLLDSTRGLAAVDLVASLIEGDFGRVSLLHLVDDRSPWVATALSDIAASEIVDEAFSWGAALLRQASARLPAHTSVSTELLLQSNKPRERLRAAVIRSTCELVVVEGRIYRSWTRRRMVQQALRDTQAQLVVC